jgi:ABC-type nitrate/sulfonate/bicarbonate transport system permease component
MNRFGLRKEHLWLMALCAVFLGIWEWAAWNGVVSSFYFPPPSAQLRTLVHLVNSGTMALHLKSTLIRLICGFLFGAIPGLVLGLGMGWSRRLHHFFDPLIAAIHPLPKVALFPLLLIILGLGESSKIAAIALAAFFPMLINAMAGVQQIHPVHFEVARSYGAGRRQIFSRVVFPGSLPLVLTGARLALNVAWLVTIAVELVAAREGLGAMIWLARETLHTEEIYVTLGIISLLGLLGNWILQQAGRRLVPWQTDRQT